MNFWKSGEGVRQNWRRGIYDKKKRCFETRRNNYGNSFSLQSLQIFLSVKTL